MQYLLNSTFDIPHRFVSSVLYALPFGKGQRFLNRGGILNEVVGGCQVSTIATLAKRPCDGSVPRGNVQRSNFGVITSTSANMRQIQFALKYNF